MIINRLAVALRTQNWVSVFVELAIVVVGILIAVQLDNWNQERQMQLKAVQWREAISNDLIATKSQVEFRQLYYQQALEFGEAALIGMQAAPINDPEQAWNIVLGAFQAGQIWPMKITGPTYREVQAASAMHWIASQKTLNSMIHYYENTSNDLEVISGASPPYREMIRERMPWPLQNYIWESDCQIETFSKLDGGLRLTLETCTKPDLDNGILGALEQFQADSELQNKLRGRLSQLKILTAVLGRHLVVIDHLTEVLAQEGQL